MGLGIAYYGSSPANSVSRGRVSLLACHYAYLADSFADPIFSSFFYRHFPKNIHVMIFLAMSSSTPLHIHQLVIHAIFLLFLHKFPPHNDDAAIEWGDILCLDLPYTPAPPHILQLIIGDFMVSFLFVQDPEADNGTGIHELPPSGEGIDICIINVDDLTRYPGSNPGASASSDPTLTSTSLYSRSATLWYHMKWGSLMVLPTKDINDAPSLDTGA